jgi:hypothetical protein
VTGAAVAANSLTGANIDESTLGQVPSAAAADAVGGENVVTTTGFLNLAPRATNNIVTTCPDHRLAVRGVITTQFGVTINSTTYGHSTYTVNATAILHPRQPPLRADQPDLLWRKLTGLAVVAGRLRGVRPIT